MSLKGDAYETAEEVRFRLEKTVVLYDNKPVYISRVTTPENEDEEDNIARVYFYYLPFRAENNPREIRKYLSSRKFDLAPFKMGYFNHEGNVFFASRKPSRQHKQGLSIGTCTLLDAKNKPTPLVSFNSSLTSQGFVDMINGKYPTFLEVSDMVGDERVTSVAVGRSFAVRLMHDLDALLLFHKGVPCGLSLKNQKAVNLSKKYSFLKEEAEECHIPLA